MRTSIYARHHFHPDIIQRAVRMYFKFNLSSSAFIAETPTFPRRKPTKIVTDRLGSHESALKLLGLKHLQYVGGWKNKRADSSYVPIRRQERKGQISTHGQIYNLLNHRCHLISRDTLRNSNWDYL